MSGSRKTESRCGICNNVLGKGKGKRTGISFQLNTVLNDTRVPQLLGLPISVSARICRECVVSLANQVETHHMMGQKFTPEKPN